MDSPTTETARLRLIEEVLERARRTATTATETEQGLFYPLDYEISNHGFDDPPPPYNQVHNDDEPPPSYETLGYGNVMANSGAERGSSTTVNEHAMGRIIEPIAHERALSYGIIPPDLGPAPPREDSISDAASVSATLQQIQNYVEEVRERFSDVDLFISSLSIMTPLLPSPTEPQATFHL